jgi:alkanesulfonate monooxygenase SsuD/methylene tetrahydromethanopterin reductase-like flavin-dependent oxidoreductase (luciferase family)
VANDMGIWDEFRFGLWYDFRNPAQWRQPFERLYDGVIEQVQWAEQRGFGSMWLTEHHFCDDGYTPSPLVLAGAIARQTEHLRVGMNLMLLPLHDPVRLAEDAATVSLLSEGRFALGVGLGYRELEFEAFERELKYRPSLMEEGVEVIRRAWRGDSIATGGKHFDYPDLKVSPRPERPLPLLMGGMVPKAIQRIARIGDGFLSTQNAHQADYIEALEALGRDPAEGRIYAGQWAIIDDDPERTWAHIGEHALYQLNMYIDWGAFGPDMPQFSDPQQIIDGGAFQLWDRSAAIENISSLLTERPQIRDMHFWAQLPGESIESGSQRIEFIADQVLPEVRQRVRIEQHQPAGV